ncbi:MAG: hypothetical protein AB7S26_40810 [Sandaracinaceae bacterium]
MAPLRLAIATAFTTAVLGGWAAAASAQDCMCLVPGQVPASWLASEGLAGTGWNFDAGLFDDTVRPTDPVSVEVGPAFSSDGAQLVSAPRAPQIPRARSRDVEGEVLWCVSRDDPRCGQRDEAPGHGPGRYDVSYGGAASVVTDDADFPERARAIPRPGIDDGARAGFRVRLDRPPRG